MLNAGTTLGPYEIESALGAGVGEVYKARDTRLQRDIATGWTRLAVFG